MVKSLYILTLTLFLGITSYAQIDPDFYKKIEVIENKMNNWKYEEAKKLIENLEKYTDSLNTEERLALELRRYKLQYFIDEDDSNFSIVLKHIDQLKKIKAPKIKYDYWSFAGHVYKISKNFEPAFYYHRKALMNAEKREDTLDIIFSNWTLGNFFYNFEYYDPKFFKNNLDSTIYYYNRALRFPENSKTSKWFARIYNNLGRIEIDKGDLNKARNYINKALSLHTKAKDSFGVSISYINLGRIYLLEKEYTKAINASEESNRFIADKSLRIRKSNFENMAQAYYELGDFKLSATNMKKMYEISEKLHISTLKKNENKASVRYKLAKEQQNTLKEKNKRLQTQLLLYVFLSLAIISSIIGFILYSKNRRNKKLFEELITKTQPASQPTSHNKSLKIPKKTVDKIIQGIEHFEKTEGFLSKDISLNQLAGQLDTNPKYLSHIINSRKNKSFSKYLNDLRINYVIEKLQVDHKLQNYTIEAISETIGFGNSTSFATAFRKKTGLNPSYFIKQLKNFKLNNR